MEGQENNPGKGSAMVYFPGGTSETFFIGKNGVKDIVWWTRSPELCIVTEDGIRTFIGLPFETFKPKTADK